MACRCADLKLMYADKSTLITIQGYAQELSNYDDTVNDDENDIANAISFII